jgi:superfamily II DNA or RNA helicase/HKD family nuclease/phage repressor protein C with HTH and peptisase S24 domain
MDKLIRIFSDSLQTGFVDKNVFSEAIYQPELLVNQRKPQRKVLTTILQELENCDAFYISVAFATTSGVASIINTLETIEKRGVKGQVLVSQYLNFTQPEALKRLLQFSNIDLRIATTGNAHSKGYIFENESCYNLIIGSSNLTASALASNKEWNLKVTALHASSIVDKVLSEFNVDFNNAVIVTPEFILGYKAIYENQRLFNRTQQVQIQTETLVAIKPNTMQVDALANLKELRHTNKNKGLIISATGTGKTYLAAFDALEAQPKKLLFVVHRLTIAKDALNTFKRVFGDSRSMGVFSGNQRDVNSDFLFSTVQTISKPEHYAQFDPSHFDYIIIDESHRSGADSYLRLMEYFKPAFLLGMTATPERTDGNDIFELFDHNIAYEIRLNRAMEEEMLSSFHYYGVTDLIIENQEIENKQEFNYLTSDERVNRILEKAHFYGSDNGITRGLVFCSRKKEAIQLSTLFNQRGLRTVSLTGDSSNEERAHAITQLESDDLSEKLDYIFTVDIFNEGIDIPKINQIIMMRPTESAIIFIQQLGRGLRKVEGKGYLTVIDFIGNYENNYLIPIALYGDTSYNKDALRKLMTEGSLMIPGASTINFDEITKDQIFKSIDSANMQMLADLKKDYFLLKYKLGRTPMMMDFIAHGSRDPYLFVNYSSSYYNFIQKAERNQDSSLNSISVKLLELFSKEINNSKRVEESLILQALLNNQKMSVSQLQEKVSEEYGYLVSNETVKSCVSNLNFEFIREKKNKKLISAKEIYNIDVLSIGNQEFVFSNEFKKLLESVDFKDYLLDSTNYSIYQFNKLFEKENWQNGFILYRKYSRKDVFRILNVSENPVAQNVGGYLVSPDNTHCPIFVNYHKEDHISESTKYEDAFVNQKEFDWMSKSNRKVQSNDVQSILGKKGEIRLPLFIKKNNDEGQDFYFMGEVSPALDSVVQTSMNSDNGKKVAVVKIRFHLKSPVSDVMYRYLEENRKETSADVIRPIKSINSQNVIVFPDEKEGEKVLPTIPLYDFYAAAGSFSEMQSEKNYTNLEVSSKYASIDYFACEIIGDSMNRVIPNGSICLFKKYEGGSRNGKIVLVENRDIQDSEFNSAFTIKTYSSSKVITEEGWSHAAITLRPNSFNKAYEPIVIDERNSEGMRVIGEFVKVLNK